MRKKASVTDCCICLFSVTVCQSLFIAYVPITTSLVRGCEANGQTLFARISLQVHSTVIGTTSSWILLSSLCEFQTGLTRSKADLQRTFANLEEDVETEDAWEMASRRASVLSRKASNHSLRVPAPEGVSVAASSGMAEAPTAVQEDADLERILYRSGGVEVQGQGDVVNSDDLASLSLDRRGNGNETTVHETPDLSESGHGLGVPIASNRNPQASTSFSQAATPMNDTFLSTLAPGMHQRLDLADQAAESTSSHGHGSGSGLDVPETLEEEDDFVIMDGIGSGRSDGRHGQGEDEMMFS